MKIVSDFKSMKEAAEKIAMLTCYDFPLAKILNQSDIDIILVGDSVAMTVYGEQNTLSADLPMMSRHIKAVRNGAPNKFIVGDMPFLSYRKSLVQTVSAAEVIMRAGANAVKMEGALGNAKAISHLVQSGVPVMGHIGLTPQHIHSLGGFNVQGKSLQAKQKLLDDARALTDAGCFSLVIECVPKDLAELITKEIPIPTIGIGAGPMTDGQVLVINDLLGFDNDFNARFVKKYLLGFSLFQNAIKDFVGETKAGIFPSAPNSYL